MLARPSVLLILLGSVAVSACTPTTHSPVSIAPSASPSAEGFGNLPPGCALIDMRGPSGERIELDGTWTEVGTAGELMTWWIRTSGDCVWGAGATEQVAPERDFGARPDEVQSLAGRIGSDFVITGEIIWLGPSFAAPGVPDRYSPLRMLIEFRAAGEIILREDREPGVSGPRCPDPGGYCPAPLVLQRVD